jgi:hypothetical protein
MDVRTIVVIVLAAAAFIAFLLRLVLWLVGLMRQSPSKAWRVAYGALILVIIGNVIITSIQAHVISNGYCGTCILGSAPPSLSELIGAFAGGIAFAAILFFLGRLWPVLRRRQKWDKNDTQFAVGFVLGLVSLIVSLIK